MNFDLQNKEKLFNDLVLEWNKKLNLVSRKRTDVYDLIEDSKLFFESIDFTRNPSILDLGTGGGFPGVIIKLNHPESRITLVDSIKKKTNALSDIIRRLGLTDTPVICLRAEELSRSPEFRNSFDYVVARCVAILDRLAKWSKDLLKPGGKLITLKGGVLEKEIQRTEKQRFIKDIKLIGKYGKEIIEVTFA